MLILYLLLITRIMATNVSSNGMNESSANFFTTNVDIMKNILSFLNVPNNPKRVNKFLSQISDSTISVEEFIERIIVFCDVADDDKPIVDSWYQTAWNSFDDDKKQIIKATIKRNFIRCNNYDRYLLSHLNKVNGIEHIKSSFMLELFPENNSFTSGQNTTFVRQFSCDLARWCFSTIITSTSHGTAANQSSNASYARAAIGLKNLRDVITYFMTRYNFVSTSFMFANELHQELNWLFIRHGQDINIYEPSIILHPQLVTNFLKFWFKISGKKFIYLNNLQAPWLAAVDKELKRVLIMNSQKRLEYNNTYDFLTTR
eukprot:213166_1